MTGRDGHMNQEEIEELLEHTMADSLHELGYIKTMHEDEDNEQPAS